MKILGTFDIGLLAGDGQFSSERHVRNDEPVIATHRNFSLLVLYCRAAKI